MPDLSALERRIGGSLTIFHTYSRYARANEDLLTAYQLLDLVPKGRDEAGLE